MMAARFEGGEAESALFARGESINFRKSLNFFRLRRVREGHQAPRTRLSRTHGIHVWAFPRSRSQ